MYIPVMKKDKKEIGWVRIVSSIIVSFIGIVISLFLLDKQAINSDNFVQLISITLLCSFAIAYFNRISEISLLGKFSVRFQEIEKEAEKLLNELKIEVLILRLDRSINSDSTFGGNHYLIRKGSIEFFEIVNEIHRDGLIRNDEILKIIIKFNDFLLKGQHDYIIKAGYDENNKNPLIINELKVEDPQKIKSIIKSGHLNNSAKINTEFSGDRMFFEKQLNLAIQSYENLLKVEKWIQEAKYT